MCLGDIVGQQRVDPGIEVIQGKLRQVHLAFSDCDLVTMHRDVLNGERISSLRFGIVEGGLLEGRSLLARPAVIAPGDCIIGVLGLFACKISFLERHFSYGFAWSWVLGLDDGEIFPGDVQVGLRSLDTALERILSLLQSRLSLL